MSRAPMQLRAAKLAQLDAAEREEGPEVAYVAPRKVCCAHAVVVTGGCTCAHAVVVTEARREAPRHAQLTVCAHAGYHSTLEV